MHRKIRHVLTGVIALQALAASACSSGPDRVERGSDDRTQGGFDGFDMSSSPLLVAGCTITGTAMNVIVKDGESALVSLRALDSVVTVNGNVFTGPDGGAGSTIDSGRPCEVPLAGGTINIVADTGGTYAIGRSVVLDYINGLFALGNATAAGIKIDFTLTADTNSGAKNSLRVRGSDGIDLFAIGAGTTLPVLNVNARFVAPTGADAGPAVDAGATGSQAGGTGGVTVTTDLIADVSLKNIGSVMIATGAGDDRIDGAGGAGTGLPYAGVLRLFGNDGADTITGGSAADLLTGGLGNDVLNGCAGNDTYAMGAAPAGADVIAQVCPIVIAAGEGRDTVDYSARTGALAVNLSNTLTASNSSTDTPVSGESSGDGAHISDKVVTIKLGKGDDAITMTNSTVTHVVNGGPGDDSFTGSGKAADSFDGDLGDDTCVGVNAVMDYSARTTPLKVTACASSCGADDNDGDQASGFAGHSGTDATTVAGGGIGLATLTSTNSKFTAASPGNTITLSGCTTASSNADFTIVEFVDANNVKLDLTASSTTATDTCAFSEALPDSTTNTGTGATLSTKTVTGSVTITGTSLDNFFGHTLTLTRSATSVSTGDAGTPLPDAGAGADEGTFLVVKVSGTTAYVDDTAAPLGGVTAMNWVEQGPEHDNVQCTTIVGGTGDDNISGDSRANVLRGGAGADTLNGGTGSDSLYGEAGADNLFGGAGDDTVVGGADADSIIGGNGNDVLQGDAASDAFTCDGKNASADTAIGTAPGENDILVDYTAAADTKAADCEFF
jgi:Ca2+-binding RTX toxin-like protein